MEADWEVELGPDAPVLDALWSGWIDLRSNPERLAEVSEAAGFPPLGTALLALNSANSPLWTAKCDLWQLRPAAEADDLDPAELDPGELNADPNETAFALACYLDCLARSGTVFPTLAAAESWARAAVARLRAANLRCCRADLVIRRAFAANADGLGVTAYLTACGPTEPAARDNLAQALNAFSLAALTLQ
jgi:hypothetical protein